VRPGDDRPRPVPVEGFTVDLWEIGDTAVICDYLLHGDGTRVTFTRLGERGPFADVTLPPGSWTATKTRDGRLVGVHRRPTSETSYDGLMFEIRVEADDRVSLDWRGRVRAISGDRRDISPVGEAGLAMAADAGDGGISLCVFDFATGHESAFHIPGRVAPYQRSGNYPMTSDSRLCVLDLPGDRVSVHVGRGLVVGSLVDSSKPVDHVGWLESRFHVLDQVYWPERNLLILSSAYGGVTAVDMATGRPVAEFSASRNFAGADFRGARGLPRDVAGQLRRNGALVDPP
jgi:hypothetical protein